VHQTNVKFEYLQTVHLFRLFVLKKYPITHSASHVGHFEVYL